MSVSLSGSLSDQRSNYIHSAVAASMRYRGLFDARPEDWIGFGLTWIDMSSHYARNQRYMNQISGATDYNDPAYQPVAGHSLNGELYYRFRPVSRLELQPGLQYWHRPGGVAQTRGCVGSGVENRRDLLIVAILITFFTCQVERAAEVVTVRVLDCNCCGRQNLITGVSSGSGFCFWGLYANRQSTQ